MSSRVPSPPLSLCVSVCVCAGCTNIRASVANSFQQMPRQKTFNLIDVQQVANQTPSVDGVAQAAPRRHREVMLPNKLTS